MDLKFNREMLEKMADAEDQCISISAGCVEPNRTWRDWLRYKLFPAKHCFRTETDFEFRDCVIVHSVTKLDWTDRLRVLLTGVVCVTTRTMTEHEVGKATSNSTCHIGTSRDLSQ